MSITSSFLPSFCGEEVTAQQLELICAIRQRYPGLSRTELTSTICELLGWVRENGKPKTVEGLAYLEKLEQRQLIKLPARQRRRAKRTAVTIQACDAFDRTPIQSDLCALRPITLNLVNTSEQRHQWRSLVERHHYLGHKIPFGAHLRYLIHSRDKVLGCLQFSSPAWRLRARDQWIGWDDRQREKRLQHILCNSRFLILPWVEVSNLASHVLAKSARQVATDWFDHYHITPWLLESMVDSSRFSGICYRAANWIDVGATSGRGRNDRTHQRHGASPKQVWLYPLDIRCRDRLCQGL